MYVYMDHSCECSHVFVHMILTNQYVSSNLVKKCIIYTCIYISMHAQVRANEVVWLKFIVSWVYIHTYMYSWVIVVCMYLCYSCVPVRMSFLNGLTSICECHTRTRTQCAHICTLIRQKCTHTSTLQHIHTVLHTQHMHIQLRAYSRKIQTWSHHELMKNPDVRMKCTFCKQPWSVLWGIFSFTLQNKSARAKIHLRRKNTSKAHTETLKTAERWTLCRCRRST